VTRVTLQIDFPFRIDGRGRTATTGVEDHIRDMIEQFLFTSPGERVNRPEFGSGLLAKVFDPNSAELATALEFSLQAGLQRWLGDLVEVRALEVTSEDATLRVRIDYALRASGEVRRETLTPGGAP
jgi:phage baseplate assembly protein W